MSDSSSSSSDDERPAAKSSAAASSETSWKDSIPKARTAIQSLSSIITPIPPSVASSTNPAHALLHDYDLAAKISSLLRQPDSGAGDNHLCRWLYDTFQSSDSNLQLVVLRHLPVISGVYLSRVVIRRPLAGFEAVLLALYAHETTSRAGEALTLNIPDMSHASLYHENKAPCGKNNATGLHLAVISPSLEPHGTMRSTRRARIVGVALELYYNRIAKLPVASKIDFCEYCIIWAGQDGDMFRDDYVGKDQEGENSKKPNQKQQQVEKQVGASAKHLRVRKPGRIPLPWELLQPILRILGHCLLAPAQDEELLEMANAASRSLYARALHDLNPKAILGTGSLLRLGKLAVESNDAVDPTEIKMSNKISL